MTDDYTNNRPFFLKVYDISTHKHLETLNGESLVVTSNRLLWVWAQLRQHSKARETRERLNFTRAHIFFFVTKAATFLVSLLLLHDIFCLNGSSMNPGLLIRSILTHAKRLFSAGNR